MGSPYRRSARAGSGRPGDRRQRGAPHRLDGKVAVVTGAGSGMGREMARALAEDGATVAAVEIDPERLDRLAAEPVFADRLVGIAADISRFADCAEAVERTIAEAGGVDILVNCAGVSMGPARPDDPRGMVDFWDIDPAGWERIVAINTNGAFYMTRQALPTMRTRGWGRIVNVTTSLSTMLTPGLSAYGASKAGLEAATAAWARELAGTGITVNVLYPGGMTDTPFLPDDVPRQGLLKPDIMAAPIRWLVSEASEGITGYRFAACLWDGAVPGAEAAARISAPVAWPEEAEREARERGEI